MSTPVEKVAVLLYRAKSIMEDAGSDFQKGLTALEGNRSALDRVASSLFRNICTALDTVTDYGDCDAPALRDAEDAATPRLDGSWAEPRPELPGTPLCQCTDPECPHCGGECDVLPMYHLVRLDMDRLDDHRSAHKVQMCEHCGEDALESGPFALDHTVGD